VKFIAIDSVKRANVINKVAADTRDTPLKVFIQVNTSGEEGIIPILIIYYYTGYD